MNLASQDRASWRVKYSLLRDCRTYWASNPRIWWLLALNGVIYPYLRLIMTPGIRKKALYYASMLTRVGRSSRASGKNGDEPLSVRAS
jgi:hypothetical protein